MNELLEKRLKIEQLIRECSTFSEEETNRIIRKFFDSVPKSVEILVKEFNFDKKQVLDIGCSLGQSLLYWREDSEGIEVREKMIGFLRALDRNVYKINVEDGFSELGEKKFEAIYTNNLLEHLVAPHLFLARLNFLLKPNGVLAIGCPIVPPAFIFWLYRLFGFRGWLAKEHVNFFTNQTLKLFLERAGFEIKAQYAPKVYGISAFPGRVFAGLSPHCLLVCQKINSFKYPDERIKEFDPAWALELEYFR